MNEVILNPDGTEVPVQKPEGTSPSETERIRVLENNQANLINVINNWTTVLRTLVANSTQIYPQIDTNYQDNKLHIRAPKDVVRSTSILLVLPTETMAPAPNTTEIDGAELVIHAGGSTRIRLSIVKEDYDGNIVKLQTGDIVSNRLCAFRFDPYTSDRIILCHALSFDSLSVNKFICNEAVFNSFPRINMGNGQYETVLSAESSAKLQDELDERYQKKIVFGTVPPEEYIKDNYLESGQIYIQKGE